VVKEDTEFMSLVHTVYTGITFNLCNLFPKKYALNSVTFTITLLKAPTAIFFRITGPSSGSTIIL
jgi:hypothetical protein